MITLILLVIVSFLIGSIPTAYIAGRLARGIDIRRHGSGNVGATNVFRVIGKKWGSAVLAIDMLKGFIPAFFFTQFFAGNPRILGLVFGLAAIAGHNWTPFLKFKGGKGVAASAGIFLAILPKAILSAAGVWIFVVLLTNYIAMGSIVGSFSLVLFIAIFYRDIPEFSFLLIASLALACLVVYTHRANIDRIRKGTEHKIFKRRSSS